MIGNLKATGDEFECAEIIANQLQDVEWWVRNVDRKPNSFWLQTASDKFYPDFVVRLKNGVTLAVEYKGKHIADSRDSREKKQIGNSGNAAVMGVADLFGWKIKTGSHCGMRCTSVEGRHVLSVCL